MLIITNVQPKKAITMLHYDRLTKLQNRLGERCAAVAYFPSALYLSVLLKKVDKDVFCAIRYKAGTNRCTGLNQFIYVKHT